MRSRAPPSIRCAHSIGRRIFEGDEEKHAFHRRKLQRRQSVVRKAVDWKNFSYEFSSDEKFQRSDSNKNPTTNFITRPFVAECQTRRRLRISQRQMCGFCE